MSVNELSSLSPKEVRIEQAIEDGAAFPLREKIQRQKTS